MRPHVKGCQLVKPRPPCKTLPSPSKTRSKSPSKSRSKSPSKFKQVEKTSSILSGYSDESKDKDDKSNSDFNYSEESQVNDRTNNEDPFEEEIKIDMTVKKPMINRNNGPKKAKGGKKGKSDTGKGGTKG